MYKRQAETGVMKVKHPDKPFINECLMEIADGYTADRIIETAAAEGILAGVKVDEHQLLVAVTEQQSKADIDRYVSIVKNMQP